MNAADGDTGRWNMRGSDTELLGGIDWREPAGGIFATTSGSGCAGYAGCAGNSGCTGNSGCVCGACPVAIAAADDGIVLVLGMISAPRADSGAGIGADSAVSVNTPLPGLLPGAGLLRLWRKRRFASALLIGSSGSSSCGRDGGGTRGVCRGVFPRGDNGGPPGAKIESRLGTD